MDTPVAIGIAAAFAASVWATLTGEGEVWFDTVTMFVFLLLGARHLEWLARLRASRAIDALAVAAPQSVLRLSDAGPPQQVSALSLQPGDRFLVGTGEAVAVDALLTHDQGRFDVSLLTGESRPVERRQGDRIPGGAINLGAPATLEAVERQADSTLSTIARLAARAAAARPPWLSLTEAIARSFTVGLLMLSALVWVVWHAIDPAQAWPIAIAVLVVSCPCALSLATPAALAAASSTALGRGMIAARGDALEAIARATDVVFDKTGTLTRGEPAVEKVDLLADLDTRSCLAVAAALEVANSHPLARAIGEAARRAGAAPRVAQALITHPGEGVEAVVDGRRWRLGHARFALAGAPSADPPVSDASHDHTEVWLVRDGQPVARLLLADTLRDETPAVIQALGQAGLQLHLVSGDRAAVVDAVAQRLGISSRHGEASPADKLDFVRALQSQGRRVLAIGDGVNDAPLLAAADSSIAVGCASTLARTSAAVVLLGNRLDDVLALRTLALRTRRLMAQNLAWALGYNLLAIPAAAFGWIAPWVAALGMSASSLLVAANALRLLEPRKAADRARIGAM
jgi:Cu2+-exporting ATPase